jgi:enamine deaminase RidA (YjgF/YER057c/UK114 family)
MLSIFYAPFDPGAATTGGKLSAIETRLNSLGFQLPAPPAPGSNYVSFVVQDRFVFLAGVISTSRGSLITGTVGADKVSKTVTKQPALAFLFNWPT